MTASTPLTAELAALAEGLRAGDRRALARAITRIESTRAADRMAAEALLMALMPHAGGAFRVGVSGVPGAGKSTFIETLGMDLIARGHRVAVLAVDPTSRRTGGSILGDKTRMERLSREAGAFIRPSPAGMTLGGVARRTREAMICVEAAGFDIVLVETVGIGQSETAVSEMTDLFLLLLSPAGGDELQGVKRGVMELADIVVVTKADGDLEMPARRAAADYSAALHLMRPAGDGWRAEVATVSALENRGVTELWARALAARAAREASGALAARRAEQAKRWLDSELREGLLEAFMADPALAGMLARAEDAAARGEVFPPAAARTLLARFRGQV